MDIANTWGARRENKTNNPKTASNDPLSMKQPFLLALTMKIL